MTNAFLAPRTLLTHKLQRTSTKRCPTRNYPICRIAEARPPVQVNPSPVVQSLAARLREDLESFFDPAHRNDYSLYTTDFQFEDPLTKMRGVKKYEKHITFLERSILFSDPQFNVLDFRVIGDRLDTIRTRWYLSLTANLPWRPCATFTGESEYVVDMQSGKICKQFDVWDSLEDSSFFSLSAVKDFATQLAPSQPSLNQLRSFDLLRRTRDYEIRSYEVNSSKGAFLEVRNDSTPVPTHSPSKAVGRTEGIRLKNVAVMKLPGVPKKKPEFVQAERTLRSLLSNVSFAVPGKTCVYVQDVIKGTPVHELWLELSEANTQVDY